MMMMTQRNECSRWNTETWRIAIFYDEYDIAASIARSRSWMKNALRDSVSCFLEKCGSWETDKTWCRAVQNMCEDHQSEANSWFSAFI